MQRMQCDELDDEAAQNEADHEPAERDPMEEEAWQRDICSLANAFCPTMVLMFMRAGTQIQAVALHSAPSSLNTCDLSARCHPGEIVTRWPSRAALGAVLSARR